MFVYQHSQRENPKHFLFVQPGVDHPETSEWFDSEGKPKLLQVVFEFGKADVIDNLGQYLIDKKYASKHRIIISEDEV